MNIGKNIVVPRRYNDKLKFENLIEDGENPLGMTSQTANGTGHWAGTGWNKVSNYDMPEVETGSTRPGGRSNRTAE